MKTLISRIWREQDILFSYISFAVLLVYTYGLLFLSPYPGFYFNPSNGLVMSVSAEQTFETTPLLKPGDILQSIGSISLEEYRQSITINPFKDYQSGDVVELVIQRDGKTMTVPWVYPGFNDIDFSSRLFNIWWLAYIFWLIGTTAQLFMRPKDKRWILFIATSYLTAIFIMLGSVSSFRFLGASLLLRVVAWLLLPVYLHFHWIFPHSLYRIPRWIQFVFYILIGMMALLQFLRVLPNSLYFLAVLLAFGGSILLLIAHYIFQPDHRREVSILAIAAFTSLIFTIVVSVPGIGGQTHQNAAISLITWPILPGTYFYMLYRRNLGGLELRANRAISLYFFLMLLGIILLPIIGFLRRLHEGAIFVSMAIALGFTLLSILIFPPFQAFVERRILGIRLPGQGLSEEYSARIITSDTLSGLLKFLSEEVFPSLLIRQYAFVQNLDASVQILLSENVTQAQVQEEALKDWFASFSTGRLMPSSKTKPPFDWVLLTLPLQFGSDLIGVWLLGRRDPDDRYPQAEIPILQSLANQTAVALNNIIQTERLKAMYEANINRYEQERLRLARDLHDSVLNEMAAILIKNDSSTLSPEFQESYSNVIGRVREIVSDFRPPMLQYGLKFAIDGLADNLSDRYQDRMQIVSDLQTDGEFRYPELVEHNLYRIVQEACENALKYSRGKSLNIHGEFASRQIDIVVSDDGVGFNAEIGLKLEEMLANQHYGLAGMHERAGLIGAVIHITSKLGLGTTVHVTWQGS